MKPIILKFLASIFGLTTLILGGIAYINHEKVRSRDETILERELTITSYMKVT